ncbi:hypothetical protein GGU11DRAFT_453065 [Lentinula aff. detonsa]|nr:hypothetical protein GGU11DRAFT_453065 [Lentinula aff. detonsa]
MDWSLVPETLVLCFFFLLNIYICTCINHSLKIPSPTALCLWLLLDESFRKTALRLFSSNTSIPCSTKPKPKSELYAFGREREIANEA